MSTVIEIDDDVIAAARPVAEREGRTLAEVVSEWARIALAREASQRDAAELPTLPRRSDEPPVTTEFVNRMMKELL